MVLELAVVVVDGRDGGVRGRGCCSIEKADPRARACGRWQKLGASLGVLRAKFGGPGGWKAGAGTGLFIVFFSFPFFFNRNAPDIPSCGRSGGKAKRAEEDGAFFERVLGRFRFI